MNKTPILQAQHLSKSFGDRQVVRDVSITIPAGSVTALLGPNGAGKSTVINMLTGQLAPSKGTLCYREQNYQQLPQSVRSTLGIMTQEVILWDMLTTEENIRFAGALQKMSSAKIGNRQEYLIQSLQLERERKTLARDLSGGYKRRLHLAVSLVHDPEIVFLDEPSPGIDPQSRRCMWDFIGQLRDEGKAILLTDHYLDEAESLADMVYILDQGCIIAQGTTEELRNEFGEGDVIMVCLASSSIEATLQQELQQRFPESQFIDNQITLFTHEGAKEIVALTKLFDQHQAEVDTISLKHPSLEDIFLLLTGKHVRD